MDILIVALKVESGQVDNAKNFAFGYQTLIQRSGLVKGLGMTPPQNHAF